MDEGTGGQHGTGGDAERIRRQAPAHVDEDILRNQQQEDKVHSLVIRIEEVK